MVVNRKILTWYRSRRCKLELLRNFHIHIKFHIFGIYSGNGRSHIKDFRRCKLEPLQNFHIYINFHGFGLDSGSGERTLKTLLEYNWDTCFLTFLNKGESFWIYVVLRPNILNLLTCGDIGLLKTYEG